MLSLTENEYKEVRDFIWEKMKDLSSEQFEFLNWYILDENRDHRDDFYEDIAEIIGANAASGASKVTFYFEEYPEYIFKIPFQGEGNFYYDGDNGFILDEDDSFYFEGAWLQNLNVASTDDYCALEAAVFDEAKEQNLAEFFAETRFLMDINGTKIYISEYVENSFYFVENPVQISEKNSQKAEKAYRNFRYPSLSKKAFTIFCEQHGLEKTMSLMDFIYDYELDDFSGSNIRFNNENILFLTDYSGYDE